MQLMSKASNLKPPIDLIIPTKLTANFASATGYQFGNIKYPINHYISTMDVDSKQTKLFFNLNNPYIQVMLSAILTDQAQYSIDQRCPSTIAFEAKQNFGPCQIE